MNPEVCITILLLLSDDHLSKSRWSKSLLLSLSDDHLSEPQLSGIASTVFLPESTKTLEFHLSFVVSLDAGPGISFMQSGQPVRGEKIHGAQQQTSGLETAPLWIENRARP